jgi:hypothetical protein
MSMAILQAQLVHLASWLQAVAKHSIVPTAVCASFSRHGRLAGKFAMAPWQQPGAGCCRCIKLQMFGTMKWLHHHAVNISVPLAPGQHGTMHCSAHRPV